MLSNIEKKCISLTEANEAITSQIGQLQLQKSKFPLVSARGHIKAVEQKLRTLQETQDPAQFKVILYWPTELIFDESTPRGLFRSATEFYEFDGGQIRIQLVKFSTTRAVQPSGKTYGAFVKIVPTDPRSKIKVSRQLIVQQQGVVIIEHAANDVYSMEKPIWGKCINSTVNPTIEVEITVNIRSLEVVSD